MPRWAKVALGLIGGLIMLLFVGVLILSRTDFGRERVRSIVLNQLRGTAHGIVTMGSLRGDLLSGMTIEDLVIQDSTGAPFFQADTIDIGYSIRGFLRQRVDLSDVRLVRPVIVLDRQPGLAWNFARIFPSDTTKSPTRQGFGSWISVRDLSVVEGRLTVRNEWLPEDSLSGTLSAAERSDAIREALDPDSRLLVLEVPGGFQSVQDFQSINGTFDRLRLAHPDSASIVVDVSEMSLLALPFRPPGAEVRSVSGRIITSGDTVIAEQVQIGLPGSRFTVDATYLLTDGGFSASAVANSINFADLRWLYPPIAEGGGTLEATVVRSGTRTRLVANRLDLRMERATIAGNVDVTFGDSLRLGPTDLRFAGVETDLIRRLAPELEIPRDGTLVGHLALTGSQEALTVDGNVSFADRRGGITALLAEGGVGFDESGFMADNLRIRAAPFQLNLLAGTGVDLPVGGTIIGAAILTGSSGAGFTFQADMAHEAPGIARSRLLANGGIRRAGETFAARNLLLRLDPLQMDLARAFAPDLPVIGVITGTARINGVPADLQLVADLSHDSEATGHSRVLAEGGLALGDQPRARNLRLRFEPVQVALARAFSPDFPIDGVVSGTATVNGSTSSLAIVSDLTHSGSTGESRLLGTTTMPMGGSGAITVDLSVLPLSLATVGLFAPSAGLRGTATGEIAATGTLRDLALSLGLTFEDGGTLALAGNLDLESVEKAYDLDATFANFNAGTVAARAPATGLTGVAGVVGRGTDPATLIASITADLTGARVGDTGVDSVRIRANVAAGLASVEQARISVATASADLTGSFGLIAERSGTLRYAIRVDSLSRLPGLAPADSALVPPRPAEIARAFERARADSARIALATEVERAATGRPLPPTLEVDSVPPLARDSLAGSLEASGSLAGNIKRFDVEGSAVVRDLVAAGNSVGSGEVSYRWFNAPTPESDFQADVSLVDARASGFALASVEARASYRGGRSGGAGNIDLTIVQDADRDYRLQSDFLLSPERNEVSYSDLTLRFDTVFWRSTQPGTVTWAPNGYDFEGIELRSNGGGRLAVDGSLPTEGEADLSIAIERLQIADLVGLLQDTLGVRGFVSMTADIRGNKAAPVVEGVIGMQEIKMDTTTIPDIAGRFDYADQLLRADAQLTRGAQPLLTLEGQIPINLAISEVSGPRFAEDAPLQLDIRADSLPLESLPRFTELVDDVRGRVKGNVAIRGTRGDPDLSGVVDLDLGSLTIVEQGIQLQEIVGTVRLTGNNLTVDSIAGLSRGGRVLMTGDIGIPRLDEPVFDLRLQAFDAGLLDNELGTLRGDANLELTGRIDEATVTGDVNILGGVMIAPEQNAPVVADIDTPDVVALGDTAALRIAEANPFMANLRANIRVAIGRDTWVRNSAANVEIFTPEDGSNLVVVMNGGLRTLALNGTINVDRGEYTFSGRRIRLTQGAVVFLGETPINPILQITGEQQVRLAGRPAFSIQLLVGGTLLTPRLTIESNAQPPIAESDLLAYFAFGESTSSLIQSESGGSVGGGGSGGGELLGPVGALATQQLGATAVGAVVDRLEQGARSGLDLDVINITPAPLPAELAVQGYLNIFRGAQLELGNYLSDRWFLVGQGRIARAIPGMRLEYRTPRGFEWVTSWEPRYLVSDPTLDVADTPATANVLGFLFQWRRRF